MPFKTTKEVFAYDTDEIDSLVADIDQVLDGQASELLDLFNTTDQLDVRLTALESEPSSLDITGDILLTPADPWEDTIRNHDGVGVITLADGLYTASSPIEIHGRKTHIRAANTGLAAVKGRWNFRPGDSAYLEGLDLIPEDNGRLMYSDLAWVELRDCDVDASLANIDLLVQFNGGILRITSRDRVSNWDIGPGVTSDVIDLDSGAFLKVVGNVTEHDVRFNLQDGCNAKALVFDGSAGLFAGFRLYGYTSGGGSSRGIDLRRGSRLTFQDTGNRIQGVDYGIISRQASSGYIDGITITQCNTGVRRMDAGELVLGPGVVFGTNGTDISG